MNREQETAVLNNLAGAWILVNGQELPKIALPMMMKALSPYSPEEIIASLESVVTSGCGKLLTLANLLNEIKSRDGRPCPEEAWATAVASADEAATVVWSAETSAAWWTVAKPLMDIGDKFNASRGFMAKYAELVESARNNSEPVRWEVSQGSDKNLRHQALKEAYRAGRISRETVLQMLPRHSGDTGPIVAALVSNVVPLLSGPRAVAAPESTERAAEVAAAQRRLSDLIKPSQKQPQASQRRDPAQSRRIVLDAELRGVIVGIAELDSWMTRANAGEDVSELQARILATSESSHA